MRKASLFLCIFFMIIRQSLAQLPLNIKGRVEDSTGTGLQNATVLFISAKDSSTTITNKSGAFEFRVLLDTGFILYVTMKGYTAYKKRYTLDSQTSYYQLSPVVLQPQYRELTPVNVYRTKPITVGEDTITYHAPPITSTLGRQWTPS